MGPIDVATSCNAHGGPCGRLDFESETFVAEVSGTLAAGAHPDGMNGRDIESGMMVTEVTHSLRADGFDAGEDGTGRGTPLVPVIAPCLTGVGTRRAVRRLLPRECAVLQGFPDDHCDITFRGKPAADGNQYKAYGNSMCVPNIRWILQRIIKEMK